MLPPTRRVHYFDHQFLRLDDFTDEQAYHVGMHRAHNRLLHTIGVAYGLELKPDGTAVRVTAGVALDGTGREVVLAEDADVQVPAELAGKTGYVTVAYSEWTVEPTAETGAVGDRRWEAVPVLRLAAAPPADQGAELVLGRVTADAARTVTSVDDGDANARRRVSGPAPNSDLSVSRLAVTGGYDFATTDGDLKVGTGTNLLKVGVELGGATAGTARLRAEGAAPRLVLGAAGADVLAVSGSGVAIGTAAAATPLTVSGALSAGSASFSGDLSVSGAATITGNLRASGVVGMGTAPVAGTRLTVNGNVSVTGRVSDAKVRTQAPIAFNQISTTNTVNTWSWSDIPGMNLSLAAGTFLITFMMGGVEVHVATNAIADFRILIDGTSQAVYVTESFHTNSWDARIIKMECLVTLGTGTHPVVAQWGVRSQSSPTTNPVLVGCWQQDHRSLIAIEL